MPVVSTGIPWRPHAEPRLIFRSDRNDSPPPIALLLSSCHLDRAHPAQRLIQPSRHKSQRTISARHGGVNWKMGKLTWDQVVARGLVNQPPCQRPAGRAPEIQPPVTLIWRLTLGR